MVNVVNQLVKQGHFRGHFLFIQAYSLYVANSNNVPLTYIMTDFMIFYVLVNITK